MASPSIHLTRTGSAAFALLVSFVYVPFVSGQSDALSAKISQEAIETMHATGRFEVKMSPLETYNRAADAGMARMSIDKTFEGDLVGTSLGEMLSGGSPSKGSAGYVAIERVTGTLHGRSGAFLLQHSATMTPASPEQTITVIPGSGTDELEGITGAMSILIEDGQHLYEFQYTLPPLEP